MRYWLVFWMALGAASGGMAQEVRLRHALEGGALDALAGAVLRFNAAQKGGGGGRVSLESLDGVADKTDLPQMALLNADDGAAFFGQPPRFQPLDEVMRAGGQNFSAAQFLPRVREVVANAQGQMQALPLGLSLPALFYNRDLFRRAGLDPDAPPRTWRDLQALAGELKAHGVACPLTTTRFNWIHVENAATQHGEKLVASDKGGRLLLNNLINVKHLALLSSWNKSLYFRWFGSGDAAEARFAAGDCAMLTAAGARFGRLREAVRFDLDVAALPFHGDEPDARPDAMLPGGAALWVLPDTTLAQKKLIARFVGFMLRPDTQRAWVRATGYLPMTLAAVDALPGSSLPAKLSSQARRRLTTLREGPRGLNEVERRQAHVWLDREVAAVWSDTEPAMQALNNAVSGANLALITNAAKRPKN